MIRSRLGPESLLQLWIAPCNTSPGYTKLPLRTLDSTQLFAVRPLFRSRAEALTGIRLD
jgi:hypothetical protein